MLQRGEVDGETWWDGQAVLERVWNEHRSLHCHCKVVQGVSGCSVSCDGEEGRVQVDSYPP